MGVRERANQFCQVRVTRSSRAGTLDESAYCNHARVVDIGTQGGVARREATVLQWVTTLVPRWTDLPYGNYDVAIAVATQAVVSAARLDPVVQHVSCHRAIRSDEINRFAIAAVIAPRWSRASCLAIRGRVEVNRKPAALWSAQPGEAGAKAQEAGGLSGHVM